MFRIKKFVCFRVAKNEQHKNIIMQYKSGDETNHASINKFSYLSFSSFRYKKSTRQFGK